MTTHIGFNVHATSPDFDKSKLLAHITKTHPAWMLVLDGLQVCREIKAALPECNVIHRAYPDEEIWKQKSPGQWVADKVKEIGGADVWCYTINEQGLSDDLCFWFTQVIELAAAVNLKVVVGNTSVGTPQPEDWKRPNAVAMLRALDKHRDTAALGIHEYAIGVITSGLIGGYPDNAGVAPGKPGGRNLIPPGNWPPTDELNHLTRFHQGRFKFLLDTCKTLNINPPRIVGTEWGFDDVSDIKVWADQQPQTPPYTTLRGWKSLPNAWKKFFPTWNTSRAMFEQLVWADIHIYQNTPVEGQLIFCWGHSSNQWDQFDVSQFVDLLTLLEGYAQQAAAPAVPPPPQPVVVTPPSVPPTSPLTAAEFARLQQLEGQLADISNQIKVLLEVAAQRKAA